jgi:hypothetical protein
MTISPHFITVSIVSVYRPNVNSSCDTYYYFQIKDNRYTERLVFNLDKRFYTGYSWKHIEDLPRMILLTGTPVQKNIVLH